MTYETLGSAITALRKQKGMTQQELADHMSVTDKAVSKWERDQSLPDVYTLARLADLFGVTVDTLIGKNADQPAEQPQPAQPRFSSLIFFLWALAAAESLSILILGLLGMIGIHTLSVKVGVALSAILFALFLHTKSEK